MQEGDRHDARKSRHQCHGHTVCVRGHVPRHACMLTVCEMPSEEVSERGSQTPWQVEFSSGPAPLDPAKGIDSQWKRWGGRAAKSKRENGVTDCLTLCTAPGSCVVCMTSCARVMAVMLGTHDSNATDTRCLERVMIDVVHACSHSCKVPSQVTSASLSDTPAGRIFFGGCAPRPHIENSFVVEEMGGRGGEIQEQKRGR